MLVFIIFSSFLFAASHGRGCRGNRYLYKPELSINHADQGCYREALGENNETICERVAECMSIECTHTSMKGSFHPNLFNVDAYTQEKLYPEGAQDYLKHMTFNRLTLEEINNSPVNGSCAASNLEFNSATNRIELDIALGDCNMKAEHIDS
jgi:hypothetical protein